MNKEELLVLVRDVLEIDEDELSEIRKEVAIISSLDPKLGALMTKFVGVVAECAAYARSVREVARG